MIIPSLRVTVKAIGDTTVELTTEQGQVIAIPKDLLPNAQPDQELYLALDEKPLISSEQHAKDVLNEVIKE